MTTTEPTELSILQEKYPRIASLLEDLSSRPTWGQYLNGLREVESGKRKRFARLERLILPELGVDDPDAPSAISPLLRECKKRIVIQPKPEENQEMKKEEAIASPSVEVRPKKPRKPPANAFRLKDIDWTIPVPEHFTPTMKERLTKYIEAASVAPGELTVFGHHQEHCEEWGMLPNSISAHLNMVDKWQKGRKGRSNLCFYGDLDLTKPHSKGHSYYPEKQAELETFFSTLKNLGCDPMTKLTDIRQEYFPDVTRMLFSARLITWQFPERESRRDPLSPDNIALANYMKEAQEKGVKRGEAIFQYAKQTGKTTITIERNERLVRQEGFLPSWKKAKA